MFPRNSGPELQLRFLLESPQQNRLRWIAQSLGRKQLLQPGLFLSARRANARELPLLVTKEIHGGSRGKKTGSGQQKQVDAPGWHSTARAKTAGTRLRP